jgi:hypothetical protein
MSFRRHKRILRGLVLGLAAAAFVAPAAHADAWFAEQASTSTRPDDRGARVTATSLAQANDVVHYARPDDRAGLRGPGAFQAPQQPVSAPVTGDGFNWGDAGIGAGSALMTLLIAVAAMVAVRRTRTDQPVGA